MDKLDTEILNEIQWEFPLVVNPFDEMAKKFKISSNEVKDRLPQNIIEIIRKDPLVELVGYKMVDGNQFGMVVKFKNGEVNWFFENELSENK